MPNPVLVVLSASQSLADIDYPVGTSAACFITTCTLLTNNHVKMVIATPGGLSPEFSCEDEKSESWIREHKHLFAAPVDVVAAKEADYAGLVLPSALGARKYLVNG